MSKEKPVSFSPEMVRAEREGRKDITRRLSHGKPCRLEVGDVLWVREAWCVSDKYDNLKPSQLLPHEVLDGYDARIHYLDGTGPKPDWAGKYRHARFMPRWVSRTLVRVVNVRKEQLQDITDDDARLEGMTWDAEEYGEYNAYFTSPVGNYAILWDELHKPPGDRWEDDPEVYRIEFERFTP
jgi:hypothetical protein